jgi:hypothetical protein
MAAAFPSAAVSSTSDQPSEEDPMKNIVKRTNIKVAIVAAGLLLAGVISSFAIAAGSMPTTSVNGLQIISDGSMIVSFGASMSNKPACAQDFERMVVTATSDGGKALYNAIMAAWLAGKHINAGGTGTCLTAGGISLERISSINIF